MSTTIAQMRWPGGQPPGRVDQTQPLRAHLLYRLTSGGPQEATIALSVAVRSLGCCLSSRPYNSWIKRSSTTPGVKCLGMEFAACPSLSSRPAGATGHGLEGRSVGFVRTPRGARLALLALSFSIKSPFGVSGGVLSRTSEA